MEIISFTGKSGTGKSYQATRICMERNIEAIIDDGLLIYKGKVIAGQSAKKCSSKAAAMRTALFNYEKHAASVKTALKRSKPSRLMIIGTSDKMVNYIIEALDLHEPDERLYIEDFTTEEEREIASHSRHVDGQHVIPAPMGQLKRDFAGYFMNPLSFIREIVSGDSDAKEYISTRDITVVRPQYSYTGKFTISTQVIKDIVNIVCDEFEDRLYIEKVFSHGGENNLKIDINLRAIKDGNMLDDCKSFQEKVNHAIEDITSFSVVSVNLKLVMLCRDRIDLKHAKG
ncbi:MAG: hypothetical protein KBS68_06490 [Clostridiales bacterium]|nr:hypothetical protein [Candidatus Crickella merdequi]